MHVLSGAQNVSFVPGIQVVNINGNRKLFGKWGVGVGSEYGVTPVVHTCSK